MFQSIPIPSRIRWGLKELIFDRAQPASLINHPLFVAIEKTTIKANQLLQFCQLRYHAVSQFESLLEHVQRRCVQNNKPNLAKGLHRNLCDERGLAYDMNVPSGEGAHSEWRQDFLEALGIAKADSQPIAMYQFTADDDFAMLVGMLLASEFMVPFEDQRVLNALKKHFPDIMKSSKASHYLQDHVEHDFTVHFPELLEAVAADIRDENELLQLEEGIRRVVVERYGFYEYAGEKISV